MHLKLLSILILCYGGLIVYASLMPFDLEFTVSIRESFRHFWGGWPIDPHARISGSDLVSNLALYIPLGWLITLRLRLARAGLILSTGTGLLICSVVSGCVEVSQAFAVSRIASAADWLLNTISGAAGALSAGMCGKGLWIKGIRWMRDRWRTRPVDIALLAFMGLLAADALTPFLPTILMKQVWQSLKSSQFDLSAGLAEHPWHWWLLTRVLIYAALVVLISMWGGRKPEWTKGLAAGMVAGGFALCLELSKLVIVSRAFNIANLATSWLGCLAGILIGRIPINRTSGKQRIEWAIGALTAYILYLAWTPFYFVWEWDRVGAQWPSPVQLLPLYHYAMGSELNHARLFLQTIFLQGLLVYLLRVRFGWFDGTRRGIALAALAAGALGVLQEGGQIFLPSRTPSATDIYCFAFGGALGAWIRRPGSHALPATTHRKQSHPGPEPEPDSQRAP